MKIAKSQSKSRRIIILLSVAIILVGGTAYALWQANDSGLSNEELTKKTEETSAVDPEQVKEGDSQGKANNTNPSLPSKNPSQNNSNRDEFDDSGSYQGEPEQPRVTRAEQSGSSIKVTAILERSSPGYCQLQLSKAGQQTITRKTEVIVGPSYYACGFTLSRSDFSTSGEWQAVVLHYVNNASTASEPKILKVN